ncbi:hypothetical protein ACE6H2_004461 [Prunus campanulata]
MDSSASVVLSSPCAKLPNLEGNHGNIEKGGVAPFIDSAFLQKQSQVPTGFVWPEADLVSAHQELNEPLVDLEGFFKGDVVATENAAKAIRSSCVSHGFFQVTNHGVDLNLIKLADDHLDQFFKLPVEEKAKVKRCPGSPYGYSGSHADRFSAKLPWKETLSFAFHQGPNPVVADFCKSKLGKDFEETGRVYQKYCEAMHNLALSITELLAISLKVDRMHYREFFEDAHSILRCNFYPTCQEPSLSLGTGPHCDPISLTILYQDQVRGLDVFVNNIWQTVRPIQGALVINIGDTFSALTNGMYKSCLHRAVVNSQKERRSMAFFLCPRDDKVVKPPEDLLRIEGMTRKFPDFTWSDFLRFTQYNYRPDETTLQKFSNWLLSADNNKHL